jgi:hypothetical protein
MTDSTSRDGQATEARALHKVRCSLNQECSTYLSEFVLVARLTASIPAKRSRVSRVRVSLRRTDEIFKALFTTSRLQSAAKELPCHD